MRRLAGLGMALGLLAAGAAVPRAVRADQCGGAVACHCGDTLTGSGELREDLGPCDGDGLVLREGAVLDCHRHTISGSGRSDPVPHRGDAGKTFGIILEGTVGAAVRNCKVTGFTYGIEFRHARDSQVIGSETFHNGDFHAHVGYGIHVSQSVENTVQDSIIRDSADEGIHIGRGSDRNTLVGNYSHDNFRENYYVLEARGNRLLRNRAGGKTSADLYMKFAADNVVEANRFDDHPVVVRGDSSGNTFTDNVFGAGMRLEAYGDEVPAAAPHDNVVRGGRVEAHEFCFELVEAHDNRIDGVELRHCRGIAARASRSATNDLLGISVEDVGLNLAGGAVLRLAAKVQVRARTPGGDPVAGAELTLRDATGETRSGPKTDAAGDAVCTVTTHLLNASGLLPVTPVALTVRAEGHEAARAVIDDPPAGTVTVTLKPSA